MTGSVRSGQQIVAVLLLAAALGAGLGCVTPPDQSSRNGIRVGALIPFTGDLAGDGSSIERAILMAADAINRGGGVADQPLVVLVRDTHSEREVGLRRARDLLDRDVVAFLGPQNEDLAFQMVSLIRSRGVLQVSGGVSSPRFSTVEDDGLFFRTAPPVLVYGRRLAERMATDGVQRAVVLTSDDEFGFGFANVVDREARVAGIETTSPISFGAGNRDFNAVLSRVRETEPDAIVLGSYPRAAAQLIQEWAVAGGAERWYFAPPLRQQVFLSNVPPNTLEGMVGVSPGVAGDAEAFAEAFAAEWSGEVPARAAYFYYDAMALLGLAMAAAAVESGGVPDAASISAQMRNVSHPPGAYVAWYELERGLELLRAGEDIDYRGASGPVDLDINGDIEDPAVELWSITNDRVTVE